MNDINLPPLCTELPYLNDSALYFEVLRNKPWPVFLDSSNATKTSDGRYDIQSAAPFITLATTAENTLIKRSYNDVQLSSEDPFSILQTILHDLKPEQQADLPFCGGALGYFSYDLGRRLEKLSEQTLDA